jgi:tetratricopeptide (TPR) repeat protein
VNDVASPPEYSLQLDPVLAKARAAIDKGDYAAARAMAGEARMLLRTVKQLLSCVEFLADGEIGARDALQAAGEVLGLDPHEPVASRAKAFALAALGRWEELAESIDELLLCVPPSPSTQRLKVQALWHTAGAEAALTELDKVEAREPDDIYLRAELLASLGRQGDALAQIDQALALDPANAKFALGKSDLLWRARSAIASVAALNDALRCIPDNWSLLAARAERFRRLGRLEESLQDIDRALDLQENAHSHGTRGQVLAVMGRLEEAAIAFDRGAELDSRLGWLQVDRGENLRRLGRPVAALAALDAAVELDAGSVYAQGTRGQVLRLLGRDWEALASLERADELARASDRPTPSWVLEELAATLANLGRYQEVQEALERAGDELSSFGRALGAHVLGLQGRLTDALEEVNRLLAQPEPSGLLLITKAQTLALLGRPREGLAVIELVLADKPHDPSAIACLVIVLRGLERYRDALTAVEADVLPSWPDSDWSLSTKGGLLIGLGRYEQARDFLKAATSDGVDRRECLAQLGSAHVLLGELPAAVDAYEKAVAVSLEAREVWWFRELGDARCQQDRSVSSEALRAFGQGAELAAERLGAGPDVIAGGGWCLFRLKRAGEAVESYRKAIDMSELFPLAGIELALILSADGRTEEAVGALDLALATVDRLDDGERRAALVAEGLRLLGLLRDDGTLRDVGPRDVDLVERRLRERLTTEQDAG